MNQVKIIKPWLLKIMPTTLRDLHGNPYFKVRIKSCSRQSSILINSTICAVRPKGLSPFNHSWPLMISHDHMHRMCGGGSPSLPPAVYDSLSRGAFARPTSQATSASATCQTMPGKRACQHIGPGTQGHP